MITSRGGDFYATFIGAQSMSVVDELVYVSASNTVSLLTAATSTVIPIGTVVQKNEGTGTSVGINLFWPTRVGIAGASLTTGGKLVVQSATGYLIPAAGSLTTNHITGICIKAAGGSGTKCEFFPLAFNSVILA